MSFTLSGLMPLLAFLHHLVVYGAIALACHALLLGIYYLTLHPLAQYPGPFIYKISDWPTVYQARNGNRHICLLRDHQTYGSILRTGPNSLSFSTVTALHDIYGPKSVNDRKSDFYRTLDSAAGAFTTHTEIDKDKHASRRRALSRAFSDSACRSAEPLIVENVVKWGDLLGPVDGAQCSEKRNMRTWSDWVAYDIMGHLAFGRSFNCLKSKEHHKMPIAITEGTKFVYPLAYMPGIWMLRPFLTSTLVQWLGGPTAEANAATIEYATQQFRLRAQAEEAAEKPLRKDFMHYLLNGDDSKRGATHTKAEREADSLLLIGAGADTVSTTLAAAFFYLVRNTTSLQKAVAEVRTTFADTSQIRSGPKLDGCAFLQACIEETLRMAPPVASLLPREVLPGGMEIDGQRIPAGTVVGVSAYVIHHDPDRYPDPWSFRPERWIPEPQSGVTPESVEGAHRAFCPFSAGSRGCIGKGIAYLELKIALAHILFRYNVREVAGDGLGGGHVDLGKGRHRGDEYQLFDCFGADRNGPIVIFEKASSPL